MKYAIKSTTIAQKKTSPPKISISLNPRFSDSLVREDAKVGVWAEVFGRINRIYKIEDR